MSTESESSPPADMMRDVVLWSRKKLSVLVLLVATAIWVVMEVYEFNFITIASWVGMFLVTSIFLWGNLLRLFNKEPPNLSGLEIREEAAVEMAHLVRSWIEEGIRWMFRVGAEGDLFTFGGTLAALWVASKVGCFFDLLTLLYIGIMMGMTLPAIYVKYEDKVKGCGERLRMQCNKFYGMIDDKVISKIKNNVVVEKKEEKIE
ncbi:hypothetical protein ACSBR1_025498 [Camellia fascicularis]